MVVLITGVISSKSSYTNFLENSFGKRKKEKTHKKAKVTVLSLLLHKPNDLFCNYLL
jgi:hypothetical protein